MMDLTEQLVSHAAHASVGTTQVGKGEAAVDLTPPWPRRPMLSLIREHAGVDVHPSMPAEKLERICDEVAAALGAERTVHPGAGHFVAAAPGFAERLERFLAAS